MARIASALVAFFLLSGLATAQISRPNIILIFTDDQTAQSFSYMPFLQSIKSLGREFQSYFHTLSQCSPSRASMFTGMYPHNHGVLNNKPPYGGYLRYVQLNLAEKSWAKLLQDSGYYTALLGEFMGGYGDPLIGSDVIPVGWSRWWATYNFSPQKVTVFDYQVNSDGQILRYAGGDKIYLTNRIKSQALNLIDKRAKLKAPFAMLLTPHCPHQPAIPSRLYAGTYANEPFRPAAKPDFDEADVSDKPAYVRALPLLTQTTINMLAVKWRRTLECARSIDDALAGIWQKLDAVGQLGNTYIFLTSDNGNMRGEHRIPVGKIVPYRESIQSKLFAFGPGIVPGIDRQIVGTIDLMPTFAQIAGLPIPEWVDGRSLFPRFAAERASTWRKAFLVQGLGSERGRTARYHREALLDTGDDGLRLHQILEFAGSRILRSRP